jgi:hypothetical protein
VRVEHTSSSSSSSIDSNYESTSSGSFDNSHSLLLAVQYSTVYSKKLNNTPTHTKNVQNDVGWWCVCPSPLLFFGVFFESEERIGPLRGGTIWVCSLRGWRKDRRRNHSSWTEKKQKIVINKFVLINNEINVDKSVGER